MQAPGGPLGPGCWSGHQPSGAWAAARPRGEGPHIQPRSGHSRSGAEAGGPGGSGPGGGSPGVGGGRLPGGGDCHLEAPGTHLAGTRHPPQGPPCDPTRARCGRGSEEAEAWPGGASLPRGESRGERPPLGACPVIVLPGADSFLCAPLKPFASYVCNSWSLSTQHRPVNTDMAQCPQKEAPQKHCSSRVAWWGGRLLSVHSLDPSLGRWAKSRPRARWGAGNGDSGSWEETKPARRPRFPRGAVESTHTPRAACTAKHSQLDPEGLDRGSVWIGAGFARWNIECPVQFEPQRKNSILK